jgi:hypothetical protein
MEHFHAGDLIFPKQSIILYPLDNVEQLSNIDNWSKYLITRTERIKIYNTENKQLVSLLVMPEKTILYNDVYCKVMVLLLEKQIYACISSGVKECVSNWFVKL